MSEDYYEIGVMTNNRVVYVLYDAELNQAWVKMVSFLEGIDACNTGATRIKAVNSKSLGTFKYFHSKITGQESCYFSPYFLTNTLRLGKSNRVVHSEGLFTHVREDLSKFLKNANLSGAKFRKGGVFNVDGSRCTRKAAKKVEEEQQPVEPIVEAVLEQTELEYNGVEGAEILAKLERIDAKLDKVIKLIDAADLIKELTAKLS